MRAASDALAGSQRATVAAQTLCRDNAHAIQMLKVKVRSTKRGGQGVAGLGWAGYSGIAAPI